MKNLLWKIPRRNYAFKIGQKAELPKLNFEYSDLEPVLSAQLVELHYSKHHKAYIDNYNKLIVDFEEAHKKGELDKVVSLTKDLKFNGGSHINHSIYWSNLIAVKSNFFIILDGGGKIPDSESPLVKHITKQWGSVEKFIQSFSDQFMKIQGSGWANLVLCTETNTLEYVETKDQDPVYMYPKKIPILVIDAWEHAWYPKYLNEKKRYITEIWKIINWKDLEQRYNSTLKH
jgi:Fe-Mn family superoxide dismutase